MAAVRLLQRVYFVSAVEKRVIGHGNGYTLSRLFIKRDHCLCCLCQCCRSSTRNWDRRHCADETARMTISDHVTFTFFLFKTPFHWAVGQIDFRRPKIILMSVEIRSAFLERRATTFSYLVAVLSGNLDCLLTWLPVFVVSTLLPLLPWFEASGWLTLR